MTMQLPNQIQVGQSIYSVGLSTLKKTLLRRTQLRPQRIWIEPNQGPHSMRDTMLHEALHAIVQESAAKSMLEINSDEEEKMILLLTPWLLMLLRDNPELVGYLTAPVEVA